MKHDFLIFSYLVPDISEECSNYDPVDDGNRGEDDEEDEREMERYRDDFNEGVEDRYLARNLMESVDECGPDLRCSDQRVCEMATGKLKLIVIGNIEVNLATITIN